MKIKSKLNNEVAHVRNDIGREMVRMGVAEEITDGTVEAAGISGTETYRLPQPGDAKPLEVKWSVETLGEKPQVLAIVLRIGARVQSFTLPPKFINAKKTWPGGERFLFFGRGVPAEIAKQYTKQWKENENLRGVYVEVSGPNENNRKMAEELERRYHDDQAKAARMRSDKVA